MTDSETGQDHGPAWHHEAWGARSSAPTRSHASVREGEPARGGLHAVDSRTEDARLARRRRAISDLGDALRTVVEHATATEAPTDDLRRAADRVRQAAALLGVRLRDRGTMPSADDLLDGIRMYNPVTGGGSALAPPMRIEQVGDLAVGTCTLGLAFEGPPTYAHGGVSAMLLDQLLGYAVSASGNPGMTVRLDTTYRAPVPLLTPLRLVATVEKVDGRRVTASGAIATEADPDEILVAATGTFVALRAEQAQRLFGPVIRSDDPEPGSRAG